MTKLLSLSPFLILGFLTTTMGVDFEKEVFPILKTHCAKCHMDGEAKGKVSLDRTKIQKEIGEGSIIPGDVKKSDLHWTMTLDPDDDLAMPPKGRRVPKADIDLIAKWIEEGAKIPEAGSGGGDSMSMTGGDSMSGDAAAPPEKKPYEGTFKNNNGRQVPAKLVRVEGDRAILVLPDGKEYRYPIAMFAAESQEIVEKFQAGTL